jgi:RNA polymerase sigma-70 factor (ECF subfamily)
MPDRPTRRPDGAGPPAEPPAEHPADSTGPADPATRAFLAHRPLLFSLVHTVLGTVADTEDVLQETWPAWSARCRAPGATPVADPRAYLVRVAVNAALRRRAAIDRRKETYVGAWLPEPVVTAPGAPGPVGDAAGVVLRREEVSTALLVVLETLTPLERAVFVLHEAFGYPHTETARILGRSPEAVRQLAHRARAHVHARRPRYRADPELRRRATERFIDAALGGDIDALMAVLAPDAALWTDGGASGPAASPRPVCGGRRIARVLAAVGARLAPGRVRVEPRDANGDPSALIILDGRPAAVVVLDLDDDGRVATVYSVTNPDKLVHAG